MAPLLRRSLNQLSPGGPYGPEAHPSARSFSDLQWEVGGHDLQVWRPGLPAR
jgi:hypothetical protein